MVHEWALAEAVVKTVEDYALKHKSTRISILEIAIGSLQSVDFNLFKFALREIINNKGISIENLRFKTIEASFKCRNCEYKWTLKDLNLSEEDIEMIHFIPEAIYAIASCPTCGSRDFKIVEGRGVYLTKLKVKEC